MDNFIPVKDDLSAVINKKAGELYQKLRALNVDDIGLPYGCLVYFKGSHFKRLFFSIQTSAHLLYKSIRKCGKSNDEIVLMDYGAGVGTLYTLAKMIGCKKVIYNDHLEEWKLSASLIGKAIGVEADEYIVGDIEETINRLAASKTQCDIITSRNVIEHIYKLDQFYSCLFAGQPNALIYSSTTANIKNPLTRLQHSGIHKRWEKVYLEKRKEIIASKFTVLEKNEIFTLAKATQGLAGSDIDRAVEQYLKSGKLPDPAIHRGNTCNPENGVWAEHLLSFDEYRQFIDPRRYLISFEAGFWDTHYASNWKNWLGKMLNPLMGNHAAGFSLTPFIYVIAAPK